MNIADASAAAIVLVGGASSRMGTDKASLIVNGEAMLAHAERALRACNINEIAVAGTSEIPDAGVPGERQGPLAGIVGGWRYLRTRLASPDPIVVLACDLPAITHNVVQSLLDASLSTTHGAIAHDGERRQPLIAAYRPVSLDGLEQAFERGERSVRKCFADWDLVEVAFSRVLLADADYPEDLAGFRVDWPN